MRQLFSLVILVCLPLAVYSQLASFESIPLFYSEDLNHETIFVHEEEQRVFVMRVEHDTLSIRDIGNPHSEVVVRLGIDDLFSKSSKRYSPITAFNSKFIVVARAKEVLVFELRDGIWTNKRIQVSAICDEIILGETKLTVISWNALQNSSVKSVIEVYDLTNCMQLYKTAFHKKSVVGTTIKPSRYFDFCGTDDSRFVVSEITSYDIGFYHNNQLCDSIVLSQDSLFDNNGEVEQKYSAIKNQHSSLAEVSQFNSTIRRNYAHVWSVFYLDTNSIIVRFSSPDSSGFVLYDDIWTRGESGWLLCRRIPLTWENRTLLWPSFVPYSRLWRQASNLYWLHYHNPVEPFSDEYLNIRNTRDVKLSIVKFIIQ